MHAMMLWFLYDFLTGNQAVTIVFNHTWCRLRLVEVSPPATPMRRTVSGHSDTCPSDMVAAAAAAWRGARRWSADKRAKGGRQGQVDVNVGVGLMSAAREEPVPLPQEGGVASPS
jgi:hypothetical protein